MANVPHKALDARNFGGTIHIHPKSGVTTNTFANALTVAGFTLNLSVGVDATFSYMAVGRI